MIDISPYLERLEWLKEWVVLEIDRKGLPYGFNQYIYIKDFHRALDMSKFNDFCVHKKYCNYKQSLSKTNQQ